MKIQFKNTQHCLGEYLINIHMAANKAVNGCITANRRCHLVGLLIKTQVHLQAFRSVFFLLREAGESLTESWQC